MRKCIITVHGIKELAHSRIVNIVNVSWKISRVFLCCGNGRGNGIAHGDRVACGDLIVCVVEGA
jgi:hypothetical protein